MRQYQSLKRLLLFYTLTLLIMLVLYYAMMIVTMQQSYKKHSEMIFSTLVHELTLRGVPSDGDIKDILSRPLLDDISYQLIVMQPSGQTAVYNHIEPNEHDISDISFPTISNQATSNVSAYRLTHHYLIGHVNLQDGQQMYVVICHKHPAVPWLRYEVWLPFITAIALFLLALLYLLKRRNSWARLLNYVDTITTGNRNIYRPSPLDESEPTSEFLRLGYALSRISYQLNSKHRRIQTLAHRLERLVERAPLPMLMMSRHGQVSFFNQRFEQLFTTSFGRDASYTLTDFVIGSDNATQQYLSQPEALRVSRTLLVYGALDKQAYQLQITPWFTEYGKVHGFTVMLDNVQHFISERKQLQQQNAQLLEQLSDMSRLKSVLGHELRTPLNAIITSLDSVNVPSLSDNDKEIFNILSESSQFMLTMLNDMLDMAKIEAGKMDVLYDEVDILALSQHLCDLMTANARRHNIELLHFFMPDAPRHISTDGSRLRQIVINLLDNAIKFTSSGYVALIVECVSTDYVKHLITTPPASTISDPMQAQENANKLAAHAAQVWQKHHRHPPSGWLHMRVEDTGIGIDNDEQAQLFAYFGQANAHIGRQFGGSGLGLAISNNFAQLLGGFIRVHSEKGVGSTFHLYLPYYEDKPQLVYPASPAIHAVHLVAVVNQHVTANALDTLCKQLSISIKTFVGFDAETQNHIEQLLYNPSQTHAPVLLIDYEYYERYQAHTKANDIEDTFTPLYQNKALPTLLLSMKSERSIPSTFIESFDGFLTKPLDVTLLLSELVRLTQETRRYLTSLPEAEPAPESAPTTEISDALMLETFATNKPLILVVEDNLTNQKITVKMLEKLGYRSLVAADGQQAVTTLATEREEIALILMDCRMPVMDGLEATRAIRALGDDITIIALTANSSDEDSQACFAAGMNGFLTKPVNKNKLQETLQQFLTPNA